MKKFLLVLTLLIFNFIFQGAYANDHILNVILPSSAFTDVPDNHWAYAEIKELHNRGILAGYPDGTYKPNAYITREEFATAAVRALGLEDNIVLEPLAFDDFCTLDWSWDYVQNAYYFDMLTPPRMDSNGKYLFRPKDNISREHAITIAINALKTQPISTKKAKAVLEYAYDDFYKIPDRFLITAARAKLLDMLVIDPTKERLVNAQFPITRAETAVLLFDMIEEAISNPNAKIKKEMDKRKVANGHILEEAYIEGEAIAVIPKGTVLPLMLTKNFSSQNAVEGEKYTALVPVNMIHGKKYLLLSAGTRFNGYVKKVQKGRFLIRNGELVFANENVKALHQPELTIRGLANIPPKKPNSKFRKIFKGEKLYIDRGQFLELELMQDLRVDVTNGKFIRMPEPEDL